MKRNGLFVLKVSALLLTFALVLAGCSKNGSGGGSSSGTAKSSGGGRETPVSDFAYDATADGTGVVITKYTGNGGKVIVPSKIEDLPVVEIRRNVFSGVRTRADRPSASGENKPRGRSTYHFSALRLCNCKNNQCRKIQNRT